jgi:2-isopropylmalate synthase
MLRDPSLKYTPTFAPDLPGRQWPDRRIERAPLWCSTDLRDGNQALARPMPPETKRVFLDLLIAMGFKHIEIGFPSASAPDFAFARSLAATETPPDVWYQVITQARPELIAKTIEAIAGAPRAIVNLYNGTAPNFRDIIFSKDRDGVIAMARDAARLVLDAAARHPETEWRFQYTPEMFVATEPDFALEICEAVLDVWQPTPERKAILNLEATVEIASPNVYADQIEWFSRQLSRRDCVILSVHPHNDRGTGVAAAELALLADADRVEGCLFGNGERAGNADLAVLAANLYAQGIHPGLNLSNLKGLARRVEALNQIPIHPRHPYVGEFAFTTFAGTHQDGVRKGLERRGAASHEPWSVPYLGVDPNDFGHDASTLIRVNSQSGKGGTAFIVEEHFGISLPKAMQADFHGHIQARCEAEGGELGAGVILDAFVEIYGFRSGGAFGLHRIAKPTLFAGGAAIPPGVAIKIKGRSLTAVGPENAILAHIQSEIEDACQIRVDTLAMSRSRIGEHSVALVTAGIGGTAAFGFGLDKDPQIAGIKALLAIANRLSPQLGAATKAA